MSVCLDSWAVLAWLDGDEPAAEAVQEAFAAGRPWMSWLNIGEVAYQLGYDLCAAGAVVVSGLALGIDGASHAGALAAARNAAVGGDPGAAGSTVGVAASGVARGWTQQVEPTAEEIRIASN